jgi:putative intracellular protease/amidase
VALADVDLESLDAIFLVGGQAPMYTFWTDDRVKHLVGEFYASGRITAVVCHATCVLLDAKTPTGVLVVAGKTWTGFADAFVGQRIQPFWIEERAKAIEGTNFIVQSPFNPFAIRDGILITGQQQYSGAAAAQLVIDALGR